MTLQNLKANLLGAIEIYNGKRVGVGEIRVDFMARDCYNCIIDLEKENANLKDELKTVYDFADEMADQALNNANPYDKAIEYTDWYNAGNATREKTDP